MQHHSHHRHASAEMHAQAVQAARAKAHQATTVAMREENGASISRELAAWSQEIPDTVDNQEQAISPFSVPMRVQAQFDSMRRTADGKPYLHGAIDGVPATPTRQPVEIVATHSGHVLFVGNWDLDSGYSVLVGGEDGRIYSYAHLKKNSAPLLPGQHVRQGEPIGMMGTTGNAKEGPCLHYKVRELRQDATLMHTSMRLAEANPTADYTAESAHLAQYKPVWPSIGGVPLRNGMVISPSIPISLDLSEFAGMRTIAAIDPVVRDVVVAVQSPLPLVQNKLPSLSTPKR